MRPLCVVILFLSVFFTSCKHSLKLADYTDPYAATFWGKNLKLMVALTEKSGVRDTVRFDSVGNMIEEKEYGRHEKMKFNKKHFITRSLVDGETIRNHYITYHFTDQGELVQTWNELGHSKWEFDSLNFNPVEKYTVKFVLDKDGKVIRETNEKGAHYSIYTYEGNLLVSKEKLALYDRKQVKKDHQIEKWLYKYKDGIINQIDHYWWGKLYAQHFFSSSGLPDSTFEDGYLKKYKYEYNSSK